MNGSVRKGVMKGLTAMTALAVVWLAAMPGFAASPFRGENCQPASPPDGAGDEIVHAEVAKVYPRKKDIPRDYTGCQTTWIQAKRTWTVIGVAHFRTGEAVSYWAPPPEDALCQYRAGKVAGAHPERCPAATALPAASMAAGCAEKILGRGGNAGCQPD